MTIQNFDKFVDEILVKQGEEGISSVQEATPMNKVKYLP